MIYKFSEDFRYLYIKDEETDSISGVPISSLTDEEIREYLEKINNQGLSW